MWKFNTITDDDTGAISKAFEWYKQTPEFIRSISIFVDDKEQFVKDLSGELNFSGIIDNELKALVCADEKSKTIVEGHLFCEKDIDINFASALVTYSKVEALKKYQTVITSVLRQHKFLHEIMRRSGFREYGLSAWQGVHRGKLMEVVYYGAGE